MHGIGILESSNSGAGLYGVWGATQVRGELSSDAIAVYGHSKGYGTGSAQNIIGVSAKADNLSNADVVEVYGVKAITSGPASNHSATNVFGVHAVAAGGFDETGGMRCGVYGNANGTSLYSSIWAGYFVGDVF